MCDDTPKSGSVAGRRAEDFLILDELSAANVHQGAARTGRDASGQSDGGSSCLLLISDCLWTNGIILSTFHEQEELESLALID